MAEYIGKTVATEELEQAQKEILEPEEKLEGMFDCTTWNRGAFSRGYLIITNKCLIIWKKGRILSSKIKFEYADISNIHTERKGRVSRIELNFFGAHKRFFIWIKDKLPIATKMIKKKIGEANAGKISKGIKKENPLAILKIRYAKGEITKKEYNKMKKDIGKQ